MKRKKSPKVSKKEMHTLKLLTDRDIAFDFAQKVYQKFDKMVKSVVLFGSTAKGSASSGSDIDIVIIIDDASVLFDQELIAWYREELSKIISANPYKKELHINTVKLTTWWEDLIRGDPVVLNIIRYGEMMLDFGGFFAPLKILLQQGRIKPTPEAIYTALQRAPQHLANSKRAEMSAVEGIYWAMVDSSHALLIASKLMPPSPEQIPAILREHFVIKRLLEDRYVRWYEDVFTIHKGIIHGEVTDIKGEDIDLWQTRANEFIGVMAKLINHITR